jgi:hypothetical protein
MGYRRRRYGSRSSYGSERAKWHVAQARAFSGEVGHADAAVKEAFFRLSGKALDYLLDKYGELYGEDARDYARSTIPKWRSGTVQMSGMVAKRLFELLPPYMRTEDKNNIVEAIWKWYGPRSRRFVYVGPDGNADAILADLEAHFGNLNVLYPIPETLKNRFDWLSENDAAAKERLLNHFMDQQRRAAIASARLNVPMMLARMQADTEGKISKLNHTVFVGNHHVEIKADPLRSGYAFSDSANNFVRPSVLSDLPKFLAGLAITAAVVVGFFIVTGQLHGPSSGGSTQAGTAAAQQAQAAPQSHPSYNFTPEMTVAPIATSATQPPAARANHVAAAPSALRAPAQGSERKIAATSPVASDGCGTRSIASVSGDGGDIVLSDGNRYAVSDGVMRMTASTWATGDEVQACASLDGASLKTEYQTVQATAGEPAAVEAGGCRTLYVGYTTADGAGIGMTDGSVFQVVSNGVARMTASTWSTGEPTTVCTAKQDGTWYAGIKTSYQKVESTLGTVGTGKAVEPACSQDTVTSGPDTAGTLRLDDGSYRVQNAVMQMQARQMVTGDPVTVCSYSTSGVTYASIAKSSYEKVQATRVQ